MDRGGRIPDQHHGGIVGRHVVGRGVAGEAGEPRGFPPHRLSQHAVHHDLGFDAGRGDRELAGASVVVASRAGQQDREQRNRHARYLSGI
jgi:hypothetical protein